ncbi:MAG: hypothetical protein HY901_27040 [Deltaproteobacteria bacterium]|nr:hypothetical protein [Deltaproteobacteria bacterium]
MRLVIERGKTVELAELPPWSIALDGYVQGPRLDNILHRYSFDHHKDCIRLITTATCEQVRDAILLGLDPSRYTAYVNDVDTDTALALWELRNPFRLREPKVGHYIASAGLLDAHGGGYPLVYERRQIEWIGVPETEARISGEYEKLSAQELSQLIDRIGERFELLLAGKAPSEEELRHIETKADFQRLFDGTGWTMVQAADPHVLFDLYEQGIERIVTCRPQKDGSHTYTVARRSDFVDGFDVPTILAALDAVEKGWGGGSTIGGAPRNPDGSRSRLQPRQVFELVEACVCRQMNSVR